jgi:hypothetical protein
MEQILITDGSHAGSMVHPDYVVKLSTEWYTGITDDDGTNHGPTAHVDDAVECCSNSEYAGQWILNDDARLTTDGWAHEEEEVIEDITGYYDEPILYSRRRYYDMVELYCGNWGTTNSDYVHYGYVSGSREGYFFDEHSESEYYNGDYYRNSDVCHARGLHWNDRRGEWSETSEEYRYTYHAGSDKDCTTDATEWSFGVEIEKEDENVLTSVTASDLEADTGWIKEEDGSLDSDSGYELTSPIYDLYDLSALLKDLQHVDIRQHVNADFSSSCGGHFNISNKNMSSKEIYEAISGYFPLLYALYPSRVDRDYCKAKCKYEMGYSPEKRSAFYMKSSRILEIRLFPAVRNVDNLLWRVELMQFICKNLNVSDDQVLRMIANRKSKLHVLLRKMYGKRAEDNVSEKILDLCTRFVKYAKRFNHKNLNGTMEVIHNRSKKAA